MDADMLIRWRRDNCCTRRRQQPKSAMSSSSALSKPTQLWDGKCYSCFGYQYICIFIVFIQQ